MLCALGFGALLCCVWLRCNVLDVLFCCLDLLSLCDKCTSHYAALHYAYMLTCSAVPCVMFCNLVDLIIEIIESFPQVRHFLMSGTKYEAFLHGLKFLAVGYGFLDGLGSYSA